MDNGWIKIHRKILDWGWFTDDNVFRVFLHLLLTANFEDKEWLGIKIKRGQVVIGRKKLSKTLRISQQSIRTAITKLKSTNEITTNSTNKYTIITIVKYNDYQLKENKPTNKSTNKLTNEQPTSNQRLTTTKEYKNEKNDKNILQPEVAEIIPDLLRDKNKHIQIIGLWARAKRISFTGKEQQSSFIRRNLRAAQNLAPYDMEKIMNTMAWLVKNADFKYTLETVGKYIDEDLTSLNKTKVTIL